MPDEPAAAPALELICKPRGRAAGKAAVTVRSNGETLTTDTGDVCSESWRTAFIDAAATRYPGLDRDALLDELTRVAGDLVETSAGGAPTQSAALVALASDAELFHFGDAAYATVPVGGHKETWPVNAKGFRLWLSRKFHAEHGRPPCSQATQDALGVLTAKGLFDGPEEAVAVRLAERDGAYWLDLADADWQAVRVDASGWQVVADPPVKFLRPRGVLALPMPVAGGDIAELREFVNLSDNDSWALVLSWLAAAVRPVGPYPILVLGGEQGSAKSTLCRLLRALVDPNAAPLRAEPREARDLMIAANNGWLICVDNVSRVAPWLSDALCRLSTGGGFATRQLYSDDEERIFESMRPTLINGIEDLASRGDLLDRCVTLVLPTIPESRRRTEVNLWGAFDTARPRILGALLTAVSAGLRNLPGVKLDRLPRMADFAQWSVACESALGLPAGSFLTAYTGNRSAAHEVAIESASIGPAVVGLMHDRVTWTGTAAELLAELASDRHSDEKLRRRRDWPGTPRKVAADLRRLAPALRALGIDTTFERRPGGSRARTIRIEKQGPEPSQPSLSSRNPAGDPENGLFGGTVSGTVGTQRDDVPSRDRPAKKPVPGLETAVRDGRDGRDDVPATFSAAPRAPAAAWVTAGLEALPPAVAKLVEPRTGWTPAAWRKNLVRLAKRCRDTNPERAAELEQAAGLLEGIA